MNVMVIAAHPDDEILGAGGVIARHSACGDEVNIVILGEGITSRITVCDSEKKGLMLALHQAAYRAAEILGAKNLHLLALPDNRFDTVPLLDIVQKIENLAAQYTPDIIYTHFHGDLNIDHVITSRAVMTAFRPLPGAECCQIYAFGVPSATGWGYQSEGFVPNVFIDISQTLDKKMDALNEYESEMQRWPHARSLEAVKSSARYWGSMAGIEAAEPFILLRKVIK
jgi:LmbE family N-acetylglucosaminyl deacetylase